MTSITYCSVQDVMDSLNYTKEVPDYDNQSYIKETATGTTATGYFLAHNKVITSSYVFYHGTTEATSTVNPLTETTHYTFDKDKGFLTLTAAGVTAVGTDNVYAAYKWNSYFKDSQVKDIITGMTDRIDSILHMTYQPSTIAFREENPGKGAYYRMYGLDKYPKMSFVGYLSSQLSASGTTAALYDTTGLTAGDYCTIESEVITITSVDSPTQLTIVRGALGTTGVIHAVNVYLCNYVIEICNTPIGGQPQWHILGFRNNFEIDPISGNVQLLHVNAEDKDALASDLYPPQRIFNRIRVTYRFGTPSVPIDIKRLCILMTARQLYQSMVANALGRGTDGFSPEGMALMDAEIKGIIRQNVRLMMDGF